MSVSELYLVVSCDAEDCYHSIHINIDPFAPFDPYRHSKDAIRQLEWEGWEINYPNEDYCPECVAVDEEKIQALEDAMWEELDEWFKYAKGVGWDTRPDVIAAKDRLARMR